MLAYQYFTAQSVEVGLSAGHWIFKSLGIHREALAALALSCRAAKAEQAQFNWARRGRLVPGAEKL